MKLSGQQIQALAEKITGELNTDITKYNNSLLDKDKALIDKKLNLKENKSLRELYDYLDNDSYKRAGIVSFIKYKHKAEFNKIEKPFNKEKIDSNKIRTDIVLETIECENLDEIIKKIKKKYATT